MAFDPGKVGKLQDQLEALAYDWMFHRIQDFYGVRDISELTKSQLEDIFDYANSDECDIYIGMALRAIVNDAVEG